jgi:hypothetical protein
MVVEVLIWSTVLSFDRGDATIAPVDMVAEIMSFKCDVTAFFLDDIAVRPCCPRYRHSICTHFGRPLAPVQTCVLRLREFRCGIGGRPKINMI